MTNNQIVALYENENLSVEEIVQALEGEYEVEAIKQTLYNNSYKYRQAVKSKEETFTKDDDELAKVVMKQLLFSEEPGLQYRAAKFILNENRGRHDDPRKVLRNSNININMIDVRFSRAREALSRAKNQEIIDVPEQFKSEVAA